MGAKTLHVMVQGTLMSVAALALGLSDLSFAADARPGNTRLEWDQLDRAQQQAIKSDGLQSKQAAQSKTSVHSFQDGRRINLRMSGQGAQAVFMIEGTSTELRHGGKALIKTHEALTLAKANTMLGRFGLRAERALDSSGTLWLAMSEPGLPGIQAVNTLQESGEVLSASPDWQRSLKKK
jgi:hypothetical protein